MTNKPKFMLGVTGHRDPRSQAVAGLELALANLYRDMAQHSRGGLVSVSGLAEGADRLAARVFLETRDKLQAKNWQHHGVLPFHESEYIKDFPDLIDEYSALKNQCDKIVTLPSASPAELASDQEKRNDGYEALGTYLNRHCLVLVALWDGKEITARGGTATVVAAKLAGGTGAVYHIYTQRRKSSDPDETRPPRWLYPKGEAQFRAELNQFSTATHGDKNE